jgi:putative ABC transport system substrate-binding protein
MPAREGEAGMRRREYTPRGAHSGRRGDRMKRREFIAFLGSAAAWPLPVGAQQPATPVIGFLNGQSPHAWAPMVASFTEGLKEAGYIEGQNVTIEYRWAEGQSDRLATLAADLALRRVAVIVATGGSAIAAKAATSTIPIVFTVNDDPRKYGLIASLNRPGGNLTGVTWFNAELGPKRFALLRDLVPNAKTVALLLNPNSAETARQPAELQEAARSLGLRIVVLNAATPSEIDTAFATIVQDRIGALVVAADAYLQNRREQIVALAARHAVPTMYPERQMAKAGGLVNYGNSLADAYRRAGVYTARVLKGEKPSDLPVDQATKFELVINLKTAKALGLEIAPNLLALAEELIE